MINKVWFGMWWHWYGCVCRTHRGFGSLSDALTTLSQYLSIPRLYLSVSVESPLKKGAIKTINNCYFHA